MPRSRVKYQTDRSQQVQVVSWNVGGLGRKQRWKVVHDFFKTGCAWDIACIQETKQPDDSLISKRLPLLDGHVEWLPATGSRGGLALAIHPEANVSVISKGYDTVGWTPRPMAQERAAGILPQAQYWYQWVKLDTEAGPLGICNIYAPLTPSGKRALWARLREDLDPAMD